MVFFLQLREDFGEASFISKKNKKKKKKIAYKKPVMGEGFKKKISPF